MSSQENACRQAHEHLMGFFDGELTPARIEEIRGHVDSCAECQDCYDAELALRELLRRTCCCTAPATLRARIATLHIRFE